MGNCAKCGKALGWREKNTVFWNKQLKEGYIDPPLTMPHHGKKVQLPEYKGKKICKLCFEEAMRYGGTLIDRGNCAKCGKKFGRFEEKYDSETDYYTKFGHSLPLNTRCPDNPYKGMNLCEKCYWEVYNNAPALPANDKYILTNENTEGSGESVKNSIDRFTIYSIVLLISAALVLIPSFIGLINASDALNAVHSVSSALQTAYNYAVMQFIGFLVLFVFLGLVLIELDERQ